MSSTTTLPSNVTSPPSSPSSYSEVETLTVFYGIFIAAIIIIASGIITRLKSDLTKVEASCADLEKVLRYILLPCACIVYFTRAHPKYVFEKFLLASEDLVPIVTITLVEPFGSSLIQKFYLNDKKPSEVSGFAVYLTRLRLCSQSLAFPLGVALGLQLMYDDEQFLQEYGISFDALKLLIVFIYTLRGGFQRAGARYVSNKDDEDKNSEPFTPKSFFNVKSLLKLNTQFGDQLPAFLAIPLGVVFNGFVNNWSKTEQHEEWKGGVIGFFIGVGETITDGFIPYCCVLEGFAIVAAVWRVQQEDSSPSGTEDNSKKTEETQGGGESKANKESDNNNHHHKSNNKHPTISANDVYLIPIALFLFRLLASYLLSIFSMAGATKVVVLAIILCSLSGAVPYPEEYHLVFEETPTDKLALRKIGLFGFIFTTAAMPFVIHWLV